MCRSARIRCSIVSSSSRSSINAANGGPTFQRAGRIFQHLWKPCSLRVTSRHFARFSGTGLPENMRLVGTELKWKFRLRSLRTIMWRRLTFCVLASYAAFCSYTSGQARIIVTIAGNGVTGFSGDGGPATLASLNPTSVSLPATSVAVDASGNLFIADTGNNRIRKVSASGIISTVAGNGVAGFSGDGGPAISASLNFSGFPGAVAVDAFGNLFIADTGNNRIRRVSASGIITTVAGNGIYSSFGDGGPATSASLCGPLGVAVDSFGNLFVADTYCFFVRKVSTNGIITTVAGNGETTANGFPSFSGDGGPATSAGVPQPSALAVDASGNLFIVDVTDRVRKVSASGIITTVAGDGVFGFSGDGGAATAAAMAQPSGIGVDASGDLFIADYFNNRIRKVSAGGIITTVAGSGPFGVNGGQSTGGFAGDGGPATAALLSLPSGVAVDTFENLFIADAGNNRIRKVLACPVNVTLGTVSKYMEASFTPPPILGNPNPSLTEYASYCEFTSFDWQQQITVLPAGDNAVQPNNPGPLIASGNVVYLDAIVSPTDGHCVADWTNCSLIAPPAFADPPEGGYTYQPGFNPYPFYYPLLDFFAYPDLYCTTASGGCPPFSYQVSSDGKTLSFVDGPQNQTLPNPPVPGQFQAFKTSLVGVDANENAHPLSTWTWNMTYNGTTGAVAVISVNGIAITACDITYNGTADVADVQSMVNQVLGVSAAVSDLTQDGVVNVVDLQIVINAALGLGCSAS
jgi:hypothetical protein